MKRSEDYDLELIFFLVRIITFFDFLVVEKLTIIIFNEMNQLRFPSPPAPVTPCNKAINRGSNEALKDHYINVLNNSEHTTKPFCIFPQKTLASLFFDTFVF